MSAHRELRRLFTLEGKVAVITGGASGIGKSIALFAADAGATVVVADRDLAGARRTSSEAGELSDSIEFDLADDVSIIALFDSVMKKHGAVDILINNAGIYPKYALDNLTEPQWQHMQRVNFWGCFVALREAARAMRTGGRGGRIVNISSIGGLRTAVNDQVAYNASKAALDSLTKSAALDLAPHGILVNSVLPGAVRPLEPKPEAQPHVPATGPLMDAGRMLLHRPALPEEVAGPVLMLLGAAGGYITGQSLVIDGGFAVS